MVFMIVATGTTYYIAADRIHPIGSWGISHIYILQRIPLAYLYYHGAELLSYPTWALHTFFASKLLTQFAIARYPSDIAIEADYLAFCPSQDPIISSSTLARAGQILTNCRRAHLSFAVWRSHAWVFASHRMCTRGALALHSPSSRKLAHDGRRCPLSHLPGASAQARPSPR
eukprot:2135771-Pleurochrysis_carterae.AAC.2